MPNLTTWDTKFSSCPLKHWNSLGMLFLGIFNPFLAPKDQKIFVFINSYTYLYSLGQFKPFFTPKRDTLDTPQIIPNVQSDVSSSENIYEPSPMRPGPAPLCPPEQTTVLCIPGSRGRRGSLLSAQTCFPLVSTFACSPESPPRPSLWGAHPFNNLEGGA